MAITGEPKLGETLTADLSGVTDGDYTDDAGTSEVDESSLSYILENPTTPGPAAYTETIKYQWQVRSGLAAFTNIEGATDSTYVLTENELSAEGKTVRVKVDWLDKYLNGNNKPISFISAASATIVYNEARPYIDEGADQLKPGVTLTRLVFSMIDVDSANPTALIDSSGNEIDGDLTVDGVQLIDIIDDVTFTWLRDGEVIVYDHDSDPSTDDVPFTGAEYILNNDDVAKKITSDG